MMGSDKSLATKVVIIVYIDPMMDLSKYFYVIELEGSIFFF